MTTENATCVSFVWVLPVHRAGEPRHLSMRLGTAAGKAICRF